MSGYLNRVQLIGNLGQDPEVRSTQAGKKIVTLSIATSESWNDAQSGSAVSGPSGTVSSSSMRASRRLRKSI